MKKLITLVLLAATFATAASAQQTDYALATAQDWIDFANGINNGTIPATTDAHMTADIDLGDDQTTIGSYDPDSKVYSRFSGIFDGQGHTLTIHYDRTDYAYTQAFENNAAAPFMWITDATIRNLHVAGTITTTSKFVGGIVGDIYGTQNLIEGCRSSVSITSTVTSDGCIGGLISHMTNNQTVTVRDCVFDGSINAPSAWGNGGFMGYKYGTATFENCLFAPTELNLSTNQGNTFVRNGGNPLTISNCHYTRQHGTAQGIPAKADELTNGRTAFYLQNGRDDMFWGQAIGTDPMPLLTTDATRRVYRSAEGFTNDASAAISDQDILPLLYTRDADGNITITGYDEHLVPATDFALVIPDAIDGAPVTAIANSAFRYKSAITSVTIGRNVTTIGTYAFADCANLTSATMAGDINIETVSDHLFYNTPKLESFIVPKSVKTIAPYAFEACRALTSITLPADGQLTTIQDGAFQNCSALPTIVLPTTLTTINAVAFRNCTALDNVTIPSSVTTIGNACFFGCTALTSIVIPSSVTSMGTQIFYNCTALATASFADGCQLTAIPNETFRNTALTAFTIPASVTNIGDASFYQTPLAAITLPPTVTRLGNSAFSACPNLAEVTIPATITSMGNDVFNASGVVTATINCATLGQAAFINCGKLETVTFGEGVTTIGSGSAPFRSCSKLTTVNIPSSVTSIGAYAFADCATLTTVNMATDIAIETVSDHLFYNCPKLDNFTVPKSVKTIAPYAFEACRGLTSITLPADGQLTTIQDGAFQNCSALPTITLPATLTTINAVAFRYCTSLDNVTIPSSVTTIGNSCFFGCTALTSIVIPSSVTSMGSQMFYNCTALATASFEDGCQLTAIPGETFRNTALTAFTIPASVITVSDAAFYQTPLAAITFPASVTTIGNFAFRYCDKLNNVVLPGTLKYIGNWSFANCTALANVTFEEGLTSINGDVFQYSGLKNVVLPSTLGTIGVNLFYQCNQLETLDLSRCVNVYELYAYTTLRGWNTITYGVPATTKIILPPYATATLGANDEVKDIGFDLTQDEEGYYKIGTREDFYKFAAFTRHADNAAANARLTADIDLTGEEIKLGVIDANGTSYYAYKGIFDGQRHTLTIHYRNNKIRTGGVFTAVEGATIRHLRVVGDISVYYQNVGGIVGMAFNSLKMEDCESAVTITGHPVTTATERNMGGFIAHGWMAQITMTDCLFSGSFQGGSLQTQNAAFIAWMENSGRVSYTSCLNVGTFDVQPSTCYPLSRTPNVANTTSAIGCYYCASGVNATGNPGSNNLVQAVTADQLATGQIAYNLQGGRDEQHWGQIIGTDAAPRLTTAAGTRVYRGQNYTNEIVEYTGLQKDDEGYYLIGGTGDWETFAELVENEPMVNVRLTTDVTVIDNTMVGTEAAPYAGIFDGQGHTLTVGYNVSDTRCAPFHYITGATIRHLHVAGSLTTSGQAGGGIAGFAQGTCLIENCHSSVAINGTQVSYTADTYGGIVGVNYRGTLTISDCVFDGSITCTDRNHCGGFVGYTDNGTTTATNCLLAATFNLNDNGTNVTFLRYNGTIANSYYVNPLNVRQGLQATAGQLVSGELAWRLQAERDDMFWGQLIGTDPMPVLTNDEGRRVFLHHDGTFANTPDEIQLQQDEDGTYLIASAGELQWFATKVNFGETAACARLTADIDLEGSETNQWQPIGTTAAKYTGTFDGQHHTVSGLYWHGQKQPNIGFFGYVGAATIKGLRVEGDITCDDPDHGGADTGSSKFVGGIVGHTDGVATISRCSFAGSVKGTLEVGGIVGGGQCQITDCYNEATVTFYSVSNFAAGGILGYQGSGTVQITNCYNRGQIINEGNVTAYMDGISPAGTLSNCYSMAGCCFNGSGADGTAGMSRATQATAEQLASGEVAYRLQANRGDIAWGQRLGSDPAPILTATLDYAVCKRTSDDTYFNVEFSDELARDDDGYYLIHNGTELQAFANMVNEGNIYLNARLTDDIELTGTWPGIGTGGTPFAGTFDGQRHTVSGVSGNSGLFWTVAAGGTVTSVIVDGSIYNSNEAGGIVNYNNGTITRCGFIGSMGGGGGTNNGHVAGIAAYNSRSGSITHCFNRGSVSARYVGGIVGVNYGTVKYCYNAGPLRMDYIKTSSAIIGDRWEGSISNCYTLEGSASHHGSEGYAGQTMTAQQFAGGEVCYLLQRDFTDEQIWGQTLGVDAAPVLTADAEQTVYQLSATQYSNNPDEPFELDMPYAAWCQDNQMLYFFTSDEVLTWNQIYECLGAAVGVKPNLYHVAMDRVTATGRNAPGWNTYAASITAVNVEESFQKVRPTSMYQWFWNCTNLATVKGMENLNTSQVTTMRALFSQCAPLTHLDLSAFDTHNVTETVNMFYNCSALKSVKIGELWDMSSVTSSDGMFYNCTSIVGSDGTTFDNTATDKTRAHADDGGYLRLKKLEAYAIWCADNETMYFDLLDTDIREGDTYEGHTVTNVWCGAEVDNIPANVYESPWGDVSKQVHHVWFNERFKDVAPKNLGYWFANMPVSSIDNLQYLNTSEATSMRCMFAWCYYLEAVDLSTFNTSKVTNMFEMFGCCTKLTQLDVSSFNTENVTNMMWMFCACSHLTSLDLSMFNTANVTDMTGLFQSCKALKDVDISSFNTANVITMSSMFENCNAIETIDITNFDFSSVIFSQYFMTVFRYCSNLTTIYCNSNLYYPNTVLYNLREIFTGCTKLAGVIPFDENKISIEFANPVTGYFTHKNPLRGDANGDGRLTVADVVAITAHLNGAEPEYFDALQADTDADGEITEDDVHRLAEIMVGKVEK